MKRFLSIALALVLIAGIGYGAMNPKKALDTLHSALGASSEKISDGVDKANDGLDKANDAAVSKASSASTPGNIDSKGIVPSFDISGGNFYKVTGKANITFPKKDGHFKYCPLDEIGRTVCAEATMTAKDRQAAKDRGRQPIPQSAKPAGWGNNAEVNVHWENGKQYNGWFWNKSHMIADSLGGKPVTQNLVTGTRGQNVGQNQKGGMAYTETKVRAFLDDPKNAKCAVQYGVYPKYEGREVVPRTVIVNVKSCDGKINERVVTYNTMPGYSIDYFRGTFAPSK